jgi:hypothetical protein
LEQQLTSVLCVVGHTPCPLGQPLSLWSTEHTPGAYTGEYSVPQAMEAPVQHVVVSSGTTYAQAHGMGLANMHPYHRKQAAAHKAFNPCCVGLC